MKVKIFQTVQDFERARMPSKLGMVPTMGNLHRGHLSLLERSALENKATVLSIFVNPTQFGANEDFSKYPRTFAQDLEKVQQLADEFPEHEIIVFHPQNESVIYSEDYGQVEPYDVGPIKTILEGHLRPTHFDGVTAVVRRLFDIVKPSRAYFGQKDYQQLLVIKKMVHDLKLPVEIISMPIIREASGLAMSSRNQYLDEDQKLFALKVYKTLVKISQLVKTDLQQAKLEVGMTIQNDPNWNYLTIRNPHDLSEDLSELTQVVILANYQMGQTRLLDNMLVDRI